MSQNFDRAIYDLDRPGPGSFNDARRALQDEFMRHDPRQVVDAVNRVEMQPGHAHQQIQLVQDRNGQLDIAPAPYGRQMEPPPPYEGQRQGISPGEAIGLGVVGGIIGGAISGALRGGHENYYRRNRY